MTEKDISKWLKQSKVDFIENFDVSKRSWLKAGGIIKLFITPSNIEQIKKIIHYFKTNQINFYVLGNISNTIIRNGIIKTPIINLRKMSKIALKQNTQGLEFFAEAGVSIPRLSFWIAKNGFKGSEGLVGIPGSLGGGIYMNASSYNNKVTKFINHVTFIDKLGNIIKLKKNELKLEWRKSIFHNKNYIILGASFCIPNENRSDKKETLLDIDKVKSHRYNFQENEYPNLGSLFATKNIYSDLKYLSFKFFFLYLFFKINLILINNKVIKKNIHEFRRKINFEYLKDLNLDQFKEFSLSDKTINCLINKGTSDSTEAINLVNFFNLRIKKKVKLENIILDKIL